MLSATVGVEGVLAAAGSGAGAAASWRSDGAAPRRLIEAPARFLAGRFVFWAAAFLAPRFAALALVFFVVRLAPFARLAGLVARPFVFLVAFFLTAFFLAAFFLAMGFSSSVRGGDASQSTVATADKQRIFE